MYKNMLAYIEKNGERERGWGERERKERGKGKRKKRTVLFHNYYSISIYFYLMLKR